MDMLAPFLEIQDWSYRGEKAPGIGGRPAERPPKPRTTATLLGFPVLSSEGSENQRTTKPAPQILRMRGELGTTASA